mgnify:FL=1
MGKRIDLNSILQPSLIQLREPATEEDVRRYMQNEQKKKPIVVPPQDIPQPNAAGTPVGAPVGLHLNKAPYDHPTLEELQGVPPTAPSQEQPAEAVQRGAASATPPPDINSILQGQPTLPSSEDLQKLQPKSQFNDDLKTKLASAFKNYQGDYWGAFLDKMTGGDQFTTLGAAKETAEGRNNLQKQALIDARQEDRQNFDLQNHFYSDLQKSVEPHFKIKAGLQLVRDALTPDPTTGKVDYNRVQMHIGNLLKLGGNVGAQSDKEAARADQSTLEKMLAKAQYFVGGKAYINPDAVANMTSFVNDAEKRWNQLTKSRVDAIKNLYSRRGLNPEDAQFAADTLYNSASTAPDVNIPAAPATGTPEKPVSTQGKESIDDKLNKMRARKNK